MNGKQLQGWPGAGVFPGDEVHWYCYFCLTRKNKEVATMSFKLEKGWPKCPECGSAMAIDYWCAPGTLRVHHEEKL